MPRPGSEIVANGKPLPVTYADRERVIRTLKAALAQGRLTEDEHDERTARASVSRSHAELASLTADLPDGLTAVPPRSRDVRIGVGVIIAAASVLDAVGRASTAGLAVAGGGEFGAVTLVVAQLAADRHHHEVVGDGGDTGQDVADRLLAFAIRGEDDHVLTPRRDQPGEQQAR